MSNPTGGCVTGRIPGPTGIYGEQAPTLNESRRCPQGMFPRGSLQLTSYPLFGYSLMDNMRNQPQMRRQWYIQKLAKYYAQLQESAATNGIPPRLLAAVILNELADIDPRDLLQESFISDLRSGSLGMAQIQVSTALDHGLLSGFLTSRHANTAARLLAVPQYSIEAAAREIRHLLDLMERNPGAPWPARFNFVPPDANDRDPLRYYQHGVISLEDKDQADGEAYLARMVASAYNGGDKFLDNTDPQNTRPSTWAHGANAEAIARDLFEFNLFGSPKAIPLSGGKPEVRGHKIRGGDSLSKLALEYYKDISLWPIIYDGNKTIIGMDPNNLTIGQVLVIPNISNMTAAQIASAQLRANQGHSPRPIFVEPLR